MKQATPSIALKAVTVLLVIFTVWQGFWLQAFSQVTITKPGFYCSHFVAVGDTGSGLSGQKQVAAQMIRRYKEDPYCFVLMLGDNIYPNGDVKRDGERKFKQPYKPLLDAGVKFMAVLGNHDWVGQHQKESMAFFKMPAPYYDFVVGNIHFFALETTYWNKAQQDWLKRQLSRSTSPFKIVFAHHPIFSSGLHGNSTTLIKGLKPVLETYHVNLYLAGHDHEYERFAPVNGITYIISGGGGAVLRRFGKVQPGSLVRLKTHHFLDLHQSGNKLSVQVRDASGTVIDTIELIGSSQS